MGENDIISQLTFSFDIESDNIDNIKEKFDSEGKRNNYDKSPYEDVESEAFDKFLGVYVELPGDNK